jgi:adenylosuccinate synthase
MPVLTIVGGQWGDEGKGKVVDFLAEKANMVVRFSGGDNAGHTVINPHGEFKLHLVPSGIFYPDVVCIIGNGVVVNPAVLTDEIDGLNKRGIETNRLCISDRANLVMPYHILLDGLEEEARSAEALGTTKRGIGPAFADKFARLGIRAGELLDEVALKKRLGLVLEYKNKILTRVYGKEPLSPDELYDQCLSWGEKLTSYIKDTSVMLNAAADRGDTIILEGAQGALLDPDYGTYPYTSSSSSLAGNGCIGAGIGPRRIDSVVGVFKAYNTRVGSGPMPTELKDETGDLIRNKAQEFGTTTGRPRRCGWFDGVAASYSRAVNGLSGIALTRLDILDSFSEIMVCVAYELEGQRIDYFPGNAAVLDKCQPIYETLEGWRTATSHLTSYDELPKGLKNYIARLEELIGCPVHLACIGPERSQAITKEPII